jgi:hypothetical protein
LPRGWHPCPDVDILGEPYIQVRPPKSQATVAHLATTAMDFHSLFKDTFHEALRALQPPFWFANEFCHYTNLQGLVGIIESQQVWLSDHRFLNDTQEISYGKDLAVKKLSAITASEPNEEFALFLQSVVSLIDQPGKRASYICSMSLTIDALDQWKWYGGSTDGVCIIFDGEEGLWNLGNSHPTHIRQRKVTYREEQQSLIIENFINLYRSKFNEFKSFQYPFANDLAWLIEEQFIAFKDQQYESEQEIRLTIANSAHIIKARDVMHRVTKGLVIPYITTGYISKDPAFRPSRIPIKKIIVSPLAKADAAKSIEAYLFNKGLDSILVSLSSVKFRG